MTAVELAALPDALWEKYSGDSYMVKDEFTAALHEYGQAVRKRDAEICLEIWKNAPNDRPEYRQNEISHGCIASAAAIEQEKLL